MKTYEEFRSAIREKESSGNYQCVNASGYLGGFQFSMARLSDLGLARRLPGTKDLKHSSFEFVEPLTRDEFLRDSKLQDETFDKHVQDLKRKISRSYHGDNLSGAIAAAHLIGYQNFLLFIYHGIDKRDGNGVPCSEYYSRFAGYMIP